MKKILQFHHGLQSQIQNQNLYYYSGQKNNPRQIKKNVNDTENDADNLDDFEDICINTVINTISATFAYTSKNNNSDGMRAFRAPSSAHKAKVH